MKITRGTTEKRKAKQELIGTSSELEAANKELESFSYSVSHDLRAPLRAMDGFSQALEEDYGSSLDVTGKKFLARIRAGARRMGVLTDDLINLLRVARVEMYRERIAAEIFRELQSAEPERKVSIKVARARAVDGDDRLVRVALQNLLGHVRKFTSTRTGAQIEFGALASNGNRAHYVCDNGVGRKPVEFDKFVEAVRQLGLYWLILNEAAPVPRRS